MEVRRGMRRFVGHKDDVGMVGNEVTGVIEGGAVVKQGTCEVKRAASESVNVEGWREIV
jgi:hypothetical protein